MRRWLGALAVTAVVAAAGTIGTWRTAEASDPAGVYAILDEVTVEPGGDGPSVLRATGLFCVANGRFGSDYGSPRPGSIAITFTGDSRERIEQQISDLRASAGTGKVVAFGGRRGDQGVPRVAPPGAEPPDPIAMAGGIGVRTIESARYGSVSMLLSYPRIVSPSGDVPFQFHRRYGAMGNVRIVVRNPRVELDGVRLLFELESESGDIVGSGPVTLGPDGTTAWERWCFPAPDETVRFRVRAVHDELAEVSVATGSFHVVEKTE